MKPIIQVNNLEKSYREQKVLKSISFQVYEGEILCLLGPNGAGKSTTIHALSTTLKYEKGEILYQGQPVDRMAAVFKRDVGMVPQDLAVYEDLSAERNVAFFASLYGLRGRELREKVDHALEFAGLFERKKDKARTFSGGMKRRLNIACGIAHDPRIIIMDEPTVGIDPQSRIHILASIKKLRQRGATVIYTTHYMEEVEEISTRIIIMDRGDIIASGTKEQLKEMLQEEKKYFIDLEQAPEIDTDEFYRIEGIKEVAVHKNQIQISTLTGMENLDRIIALLMNRGSKITHLTSTGASLETVFLKLTGRNLRD